MNAVALLLATAALGVDYSWQKTDTGEVEYLVRVEPEVLPQLAAGEEIHSEVPAEAGVVERFRLRIGLDAPAAASARRPAAGRFGAGPAADAVLLIKAGQPPVETQQVSLGWQTGTDGARQGLVQLDPALLRTLAAGDEIEMPVDPTAGPLATFVVFGGNQPLPRLGANGASPAAAEQPAPSRFGDTTQPPADARPPSRFTPDSEVAGNNTPGSGRFPGADAGTSAPGGGNPSRFGSTLDRNPAAPTGTPPAAPPPSRFGDSGAAAATNPPVDNRFRSNEPAPRSPNLTPPASTSPSLYPAPGANQGNPRTPTAESNRSLRTGPTLEPPPLAPPGSLRPMDNSTAQTGYEAGNGDNRVAMNDNAATRAAGPPPQAAPPAAPPAATEEEKPWMPFVLTACALFLSLGGNLYLGWTAVEFYGRYRLASERLRSGSDRI